MHCGSPRISPRDVLEEPRSYLSWTVRLDRAQPSDKTARQRTPGSQRRSTHASLNSYPLLTDDANASSRTASSNVVRINGAGPDLKAACQANTRVATRSSAAAIIAM